ncbi:helix-turn-helix transcriptional regulator [Chelativorans xinjiangense]|uniref:helix-turn-helix transcriptional regulator n=1 Tax=Chelativorans xinjiangense TaxID=2681485 RepID=UPI00135B4D7C|nr:AraC family transcriptional regulator [Chelativorans xinjiangense]
MLSKLIEHGHGMRRVAPPKGGAGLFCMASGAGYELRVNEVYSWDGLQRGDVPFVLIQHTIAGEGRLDYEDVRHVLSPGETMLLTFPHANRYWLERGKSWEYFWIILSGREALRLAGAILAAKGPVLRPAQPAADRLAGACLALLSGAADVPGAVSAAAYGAITALYDEAFEATAEAADLPAPVLRAQRFVEDNLARLTDVGMLARAAGLSRAHFVRLFTAEVGRPPSEYVFEKRMERAMRMLLATDAPIGAIARACGFADANYFSKAFRRARGCSPGAFRNAGRTGLLTTIDGEW